MKQRERSLKRERRPLIVFGQGEREETTITADEKKKSSDEEQRLERQSIDVQYADESEQSSDDIEDQRDDFQRLRTSNETFDGREDRRDDERAGEEEDGPGLPLGNVAVVIREVNVVSVH